MKNKLISILMAGILTLSGISSCISKEKEGTIIKKRLIPVTEGGGEPYIWEAKIKTLQGEYITVTNVKRPVKSNMKYDVGDKVIIIEGKYPFGDSLIYKIGPIGPGERYNVIDKVRVIKGQYWTM